jgi:hypothetical protein
MVFWKIKKPPNTDFDLWWRSYWILDKILIENSFKVKLKKYKKIWENFWEVLETLDE